MLATSAAHRFSTERRGPQRDVGAKKNPAEAGLIYRHAAFDI